MPMLSLITRYQYTHHQDYSPTTIPSPTDAGVKSLDRGPLSTGARAQLPLEALRGGEGEAPRGTRGYPTLEADVLSTPVDLGESSDSLRTAGGLEDILVTMGRAPGDVFPANRVFMRCAKCRASIPRFEGYRHIKTGDRRTFCRSCHEAMGLPLRVGADCA